jgi:hypothetical protein
LLQQLEKTPSALGQQSPELSSSSSFVQAV